MKISDSFDYPGAGEIRRIGPSREFYIKCSGECVAFGVNARVINDELVLNSFGGYLLVRIALNDVDRQYSKGDFVEIELIGANVFITFGHCSL